MTRLTLLAPLLLALAGCDRGADSPRGFRLPPGDPEAGRTAFVELQCLGCHTVEGVELPEAERTMDVALGGKVLRVRSYGELVTAIIHPSADLSSEYPAEAVSFEGRSLMADYNATMTVQQLVDLVAFLQPTYEEQLPKDYDPYFP